jgi:hypothetical protein
MGIYLWEEYFLKAVRVLQILYSYSHKLIFAYEIIFFLAYIRLMIEE